MAENRDIAIVGMACRFPGGDGLEQYWETLRSGVSAVRGVPADRWDGTAFTCGEGATPGTMLTDRGGFLDAVDHFDTQFFGISDAEATAMDPQQRMMLETTWHALEDAGIPPHSLAGSNTGVYLGSCNHDYSILHWRDAAGIHTGTGTSNSVCANRISYFLKLHGPSLSIDSACSSSLTALHIAMQALRQGEIDAALVGGSNLMLLPQVTASLSEAGLIASGGACRSFGAGADGYVRGEGAGVLVLVPESTARRERMGFRCTILGSALNHNGKGNGLTAPNPAAQRALIRAACDQAKLCPSQVDYVEAAATGTHFGDAIEMKSIADVFAGERPAGSPLFVGSAKSNIGHLEGAGGVAAVIKAALAIQHGQIPPSLHSSDLNPMIRIDPQRICVPQTAEAWPDNRNTRYAGVSSFGFGGANAHVILGGATARQEARSAAEIPILFLSARTPEALAELAHECQEHVSAGHVALSDFVYTCAVHRQHHEFRAAIAFDDKEDLVRQLVSLAHAPNSQKVSPFRPVIRLGAHKPSTIQAMRRWQQALPRLAEIVEETTPGTGIEDMSRTEYAIARWLVELLPDAQFVVSESAVRCALAATRAIAEMSASEVLSQKTDELIDSMPEKLAFSVEGDGSGALWETVASRAVRPPKPDKSRWVPGETLHGEVADPVRGMLADMYMSGAQMDFRAVYGESHGQVVAAPRYPFQRRKYWPADGIHARFVSPPRGNGRMTMDLGGKAVDLPMSAELRFDYWLSPANSPLLADHRIHGAWLVSGSAQLLMAVHHLAELREGRDIILRNVQFSGALILSQDRLVRAQLIINSSRDDHSGEIQILAQAEPGGPWDVTMRANYTFGTGIWIRPETEQSPGYAGGFYDRMESLGYQFGTRYRWLSRDPDCGNMVLERPSGCGLFDDSLLHPGALDGAIQSVEAVTPQRRGDEVGLPQALDEVVFFAGAFRRWRRAIVSSAVRADTPSLRVADIAVENEDGDPIVRMYGAKYRFVPAQTLRDAWTNDLPSAAETASFVPEDFVVGLVGQVRGAPLERHELKQPLVALGIDSLKAMEIRSRLRREIAVDVPVVQLMGGLTVNAMLERIHQHLESISTSPGPAQGVVNESIDMKHRNAERSPVLELEL